MFHWTELRDWLATRRNRPAASRAPEADFWRLYQVDNAACTAVPANLLAAAQDPTTLLVVVTTYRRPDASARVLTQLSAALNHADEKRAHVLVLNDASDADYSAPRQLANQLFGGRVTWLDAVARLGKANFWRVYQTAFLAAEELKPTHTLFLQDDLEFDANLLSEARALWARTASDAKRRVLYLFSSHDDERWGRWILFLRRQGPTGLLLTQWFDLQAFYVDLAFFEVLNFQLIAIHPNRWKRKPSTSSGVGRQFTRRLFGRANVYQAVPALVRHGAETSEMNPEARQKRSLDNRAPRE